MEISAARHYPIITWSERAPFICKCLFIYRVYDFDVIRACNYVKRVGITAWRPVFAQIDKARA